MLSAGIVAINLISIASDSFRNFTIGDIVLDQSLIDLTLSVLTNSLKNDFHL